MEINAASRAAVKAEEPKAVKARVEEPVKEEPAREAKPADSSAGNKINVSA